MASSSSDQFLYPSVFIKAYTIVYYYHKGKGIFFKGNALTQRMVRNKFLYRWGLWSSYNHMKDTKSTLLLKYAAEETTCLHGSCEENWTLVSACLGLNLCSATYNQCDFELVMVNLYGCCEDQMSQVI